MAEKEYIEREVLMNYPIRRDNYDKKNGNENFINGVESVLEYAESLPTADVAPVRHEYWIKTSLMFASSNGKHGNVHVCSNCGEQSGVGFKTPYCAICGAKMDGNKVE